jgi:hypothetical protein
LAWSLSTGSRSRLADLIEAYGHSLNENLRWPEFHFISLKVTEASDRAIALESVRVFDALVWEG